MNPLLACSAAGAEPAPGDAYTLSGLEEHREGVQRVMNAMNSIRRLIELVQ
jgi:hypothetical protein